MVRRTNIYKRFLFLFVALSLVVILISPQFQKKPLYWLENSLGRVIYYAQQGTDAVLGGIGGVWYHYIDLIGVQEENTRLRRQVEELEGANNLLKEDRLLAERLQGLLDYKQRSGLSLIAAEVIGREPSQWFHTIMVNKGEKDGVAVDMGVVTPKGIVGKVIKTAPHYSQVLLMTDRSSQIAAMVQRTRDEGIMEGVEQGTLRFKYLPHFSDVQVGDVVVTSGLAGSFSKGLKIGLVEKVEKKENELFLQVKVTPEIDFSKLEEMLIITSIKELDAPP
jgi:rod shape-determining protein MreC